MNPILTDALARRMPFRARAGCLALLLAAGCQTTAPRYVFGFADDARKTELTFEVVEGTGLRPVPGDVLTSTWPPLVLDDVAEQVFEARADGRLHRRTQHGPQLVAIEVSAAEDLASLSEDDVLGLRAIDFERWEPAMARELARVDARRCLFRFGPLSDPVDLAVLPATTRYLDMHYAEPVDPEGFARFVELRYLIVPTEAPLPTNAEPPSPSWDDRDPPITLDWVRSLPELRRLDVEAVGSDLRPLDGHPSLHTVHAGHCRIEHLPTDLPALREFVTPFSDCPDAGVERMRQAHPAARILTTARQVLLDRLEKAVRLQLRTGSVCHPQTGDRVIYATESRVEIESLFGLLQFEPGYERRFTVPTCEQGVLQFFGADGSLLEEIGRFGSWGMRGASVWHGQQVVFASREQAAAVQQWVAARGLFRPRTWN